MHGHSIRRAGRWAATALLALATAAVVAACGSDDNGGGTATAADAKGATLRIGFITIKGVPDGPEGWADRRGALLAALKPAGVTAIKWVPVQNGPPLQQALVGGSIDAGILGDTPALVGRANGVEERLVNQARTGLDAWLIGHKGGPASVGALKGGTVATQTGSYMYRYLIGLLKAQGLDGQVKVGNLTTPAATAALTNGAIGAAAQPVNAAVQLAAAGFPVLDKASQHDGLAGSTLTVVSEAFLADHPGFPTAWNAARADAIRYVKAHAEDFWRFESSAQPKPLPVALIKQAYPLSNYSEEPFTAGGTGALQSTLGFLVEAKLARSSFDLEGWKAP
jgi:sulfonate transport system substrate-binding protein